MIPICGKYYLTADNNSYILNKAHTTREQVIAELQRTKAEVSHSVMMLAPDAVLGKIRQTQDAPLNGTCSS